MIQKHELNWPNAVTSIRILLAPVLLLLGWLDMPYWLLATLMVSEFTDVLDGFLARRLNQITKLGSKLDSWGDFTVYSSIAVAAWWMWPDKVVENALWFGLMIASFTCPALLGFIKFRKLTSYHTLSVKVSVVATILSYVMLFYLDMQWPFKIAALMCTYAALEEMTITLLIQQPQMNIRSVLTAWRLRQEQNNH
jgi:CDP-diacylglycerol--glycerol-3-phosphate 3-phosphatidyltransferase